MVIQRAPGTRGVYPRVCGGTADWRRTIPPAVGLSPRVRGNPHGTGLEDLTLRSIPACAGEPSSRDRARRSSRVYPRVCGGTIQVTD